jgi:hypothetical protein
MDAAGLAGLARGPAGRGGLHAFARGVGGTLAAAVVGNATTKPRTKTTLRVNGETIEAASK